MIIRVSSEQAAAEFERYERLDSRADVEVAVKDFEPEETVSFAEFCQRRGFEDRMAPARRALPLGDDEFAAPRAGMPRGGETVACAVEELSQADVRAISAGRLYPRHDHLDALLD